VAILKSITEGKIYAPSYFKADIPEAVEAILMKALEKDRERRYQTAWEMQYDLDQFLSQYEFTPSNIHLSNFLKQLFNDELEEEKARLAQLRVPAGPEEVVDAEEIISSIEPISDSSDLSAEGDKELTFMLGAQEFEQLSTVARRHGIPMSGLLRDVVGDFLKYR
jgi:serine/threonine-protein kinase